MINLVRVAALMATASATTIPELITDLSDAFNSLSGSCTGSTACSCPAQSAAAALYSPITIVAASGQTPVTVTALNQPITTTVGVSGGTTTYNIGPFNNVYNSAPTSTLLVINAGGNTIINNVIYPAATVTVNSGSGSNAVGAGNANAGTGATGTTAAAQPTVTAALNFYLESTANPAVDGLPVVESNGALVAGTAGQTPASFAIVNGQLVDSNGNVIFVDSNSVYRRSLSKRVANSTGFLHYGRTNATLSQGFSLVNSILEFINMGTMFESYACLVSSVDTIGFTNGDIPSGCFALSLVVPRPASSASSLSSSSSSLSTSATPSATAANVGTGTLIASTESTVSSTTMASSSSSVATSTAVPTTTPATTTSASSSSSYVSVQPPATDAAISNTDTADFQTAILGTHNYYRSMHSAPALVYNDTLAAYAQQYASSCNFAHTGGPYGENIAEGFESPAAAISAWYNEQQYYNYQTPTGYSDATGHFTQVVWVGSTQVGCANIACGGSMGYFLMCEYYTAGNIENSTPGGDVNAFFKQNVLPN